jgi:SAM-dependent methyltransferase
LRSERGEAAHDRMNEVLRLMPDACVRIGRNDYVIYSTHGRGASFRTPDLSLIAWIMGFSKPKTLNEVLRDVPAEGHASASNLVTHLCTIGLFTTGSDAAEREVELEHLESTEAMAALLQSVYDLASDLRGLGPAAHQAFRGKGEVSLKHRVEGLLAAAASLRADLATLRSPFIRHQLSELHIDGNAKNLQLHIGSGGFNLPGWINIDNFPAPLTMSLDWGLPFPPSSARYVFLSHVLEHLFYPLQSQRLLADIRRVLQPGGVVRIVVPDVEQWIHAYVKNDTGFFDAQEVRVPDSSVKPTRLEALLPYAGAVSSPTQLYSDHKFGYDFETLQHCLLTAGFLNIRRCNYQDSPFDALRVDDASGTAGERYGERYRSLFVEAQAPADGD